MIFVSSLNAQNIKSDFNTEVSGIKISATAEMGFLTVIDHKIQFSNSGTKIDYVKEGGQDNLYAVKRFSLEAQFNRKNTIILLYQPLEIRTQALLQRDLVIDDLVFPQSSGVNFLYGFPFYRISYLREFMADNPKYNFGIGLTLQIRNATIAFESLDGTLLRTNNDVGIVPALKLRTRTRLNNHFYLELEADGIYAPVSYLNGSDNEVKGAILDASLRMGYHLRSDIDAFFNIRYLGGGAVGTSSDVSGPGDGYVENWLHFMTSTAGVVYRF